MAAPDLLKRPRDSEDSTDQFKRFRPSLSPDARLIELQTPSHQELLVRLGRLFPCKSAQELTAVIDQSQSNFDICLLLLRKQQLNVEIQRKVEQYAQRLVEELVEAKDMRMAEAITHECFKHFFVEMHEKINTSLITENQQLASQVEVFTNDAAVLKKAVRKLYSRSAKEQHLESEADSLRDQLRTLKVRVFGMQMQLAQFENNRTIDPSRELF